MSLRESPWGGRKKGSAHVLLQGNVFRHRHDSRPKTEQVDLKKSHLYPKSTCSTFALLCGHGQLSGSRGAADEHATRPTSSPGLAGSSW